MFGVGVEIFGHLGRQLARWAQDQRSWHTCAGASLGQKRGHWQNEARRFAGAGLRNAQDVFAFKGRGNGAGLNGCRGFIACFGNSACDFRGKPQLIKSGHVVFMS